MPETGWLLLLLFLGLCSLVIVAVLWPSYCRAHQTVEATHRTIDDRHNLTRQAGEQPRQLSDVPPPGVRMLPVQGWLKIVNHQRDDAPHALIIGSSGSGKTTLAQAIVSTRSGKVAILDPKWTPGKWGNLPAIPIDDEGKYTQIEVALKALLRELNARLVLMKQGQTSFEELTIVVEELPTIVEECLSGATLFKQIGRLGRELRIRLVGLSQSERVKSLGIAGEGDARDNYLRIRLGKAAIAVDASSRTLNRPAVLEWRGEHDLMDLDGITYLARYQLPQERAWAFPSTTGGVKQGLTLLSNPTAERGDATSDALFLSLSAEEVGKVALLIIKGVERKEAIKSMPRYSRKQHKEYAVFYDQLKEAMKNEDKQV